MKFFENLKNKKIFFFQIFLTLYIVINLIGGERGLFSYFKKNTHEKLLSINSLNLKKELEYQSSKKRPEGRLLIFLYLSCFNLALKYTSILYQHNIADRCTHWYSQYLHQQHEMLPVVAGLT